MRALSFGRNGSCRLVEKTEPGAEIHKLKKKQLKQNNQRSKLYVSEFSPGTSLEIEVFQIKETKGD